MFKKLSTVEFSSTENESVENRCTSQTNPWALQIFGPNLSTLIGIIIITVIIEIAASVINLLAWDSTGVKITPTVAQG